MLGNLEKFREDFSFVDHLPKMLIRFLSDFNDQFCQCFPTISIVYNFAKSWLRAKLYIYINIFLYLYVFIIYIFLNQPKYIYIYI
jgi:hypothetical protein